jgi:hypothetical protein
MRNLTIIGMGLLLAGCSENGLQGEEKVNYDPNGRPDEVEMVTDTYVQSHPTQADVLFVISNWWSMEQAYAELVDSFDDLLDVFVGSGIDYHIGVISTDTDHAQEHGKLHEANGVRWVEERTQDPFGTFAQMATMDATGCVGPRRPRDATFLAMAVEADGHNAGFRREEASLHTVFVSDDRDTSVMHDFNEWVMWYDNWTQTPEIDTLSTIVDFAKDTQNISATDAVGGASHPIQQMPWANVLEEIGLRALGLKQEYFLSQMPDSSTIEVAVVVEGAERHFAVGALEEGGEIGYDTTRNSVSFHEYEPPTDAEIVITYEVQ